MKTGDAKADSVISKVAETFAEAMPKTPYMQRRGSRFWFRYAVPRDPRTVIGRPEIVKALRPSDLSTAKQRSVVETIKTHALIEDARRKESIEQSPERLS
jgi:hypothetical protein